MRKRKRGHREGNMKKLTLIGAGLAALVFASTAFAYSHVFFLSTIKYSDFNNVSENIYIDPKLEHIEYRRILSLLDKSKSRIINKFGAFTASPVIVITGTPENSNKYGLGTFPGKAFAAPWQEYVVINHQVHDINLMAHELMHAQLREILGYWAYQTKFPTWFDEGIAMQVDLREQYNVGYHSFSQQELNRVKTLNKPSKFWTNSKEQDIKNYRTAKAAVQEMLTIYSPKELYSMLLRIRQGEKFGSVFNLKSKV